VAEITNTVIVKNSSGSEQLVRDLGISVPDGGQVEFTILVSVADCRNSNDLEAASTGGSPTLVLNDGSSDLNTTEAQAFFDAGGGGTPTLDDSGQMSGWQMGESEYFDAEAEDNTSGGWKTRLDETTQALDGAFWVEWYFEIRQSDGDKDVKVEVENVTDTEYLCQIRENFKDNVVVTSVFGFKEVTFTGAAKQFRVRFRPREGGTAYIRKLRIRIRRGRA
jgi:hypothetical protein